MDDLEYINILEGFGYNVKCRGAIFFCDLLRDVQDLLREGKNKEDILELLPRYYLEYYHFCYEVGKKRYFSELNAFCHNEAKKLPKEKRNMNLEESIFFFAEYFSHLESKIYDSKKYVYKISSFDHHS